MMTDGQKWRRLMSLMFMGASLRNEHGFFVMDIGPRQSDEHATAEAAVDEMIAAVESMGPINFYHERGLRLGDPLCKCIDCEAYRQRRRGD